MTDEPNPRKKIIVDEDWKSQVEAEREAATRGQSGEPAAGPSDAAATAHEESMSWPEPSLPLLITTLAAQAMAAMGLMGPPDAGQPKLDLGQAKHMIDTIAMLDEKTRGNCSPDEVGMFEHVLYELRMAYVAIRDRAAQ